MVMATAMVNPERPLPRDHLDGPTKSYVDAAMDGLDDSMQGDDLTNTYTGRGTNDSPRNPRRNIHKESPSKQANGSATQPARSPIIVERYKDKYGEHLVSFGPEWENKDNRQRAMRRRNSELLSGRKAGARWEQSQ